MYLVTRSWFACLCLWLASAASAAENRSAASPPFRDSEVVCLVGDSITHSGLWHRYLAEFYATRYPARGVRFLNAGISGDYAGGALARLDADVLARGPSTAVIMLGMNDVGRDDYKSGLDADPRVVANRARNLSRYQENLTLLAKRLKEAGIPRLILVTPSPFDQTAAIPSENRPGVDDALAGCSQMVTELARSVGADVVDFHGPMSALSRQLQQRDPAFTFARDRVHPGPAGHLVMAWLFLKAQGAPALVSRVALDARAKDHSDVLGARLTDLAWEEGRVEFRLAEAALPWPIDPDARPALDLAPITAELNRQELVAANLPADNYELEIDGVTIGRWTAAELATGVNLALNPRTPQFRQAQNVMRMCQERWTIESRLRNVAYVEFIWFKPGAVDFEDASVSKAAINAYATKRGGGYYRNVADSYFAVRPMAESLHRQVDELTRRIHDEARPLPHRYVLRPSVN